MGSRKIPKNGTGYAYEYSDTPISKRRPESDVKISSSYLLTDRRRCHLVQPTGLKAVLGELFERMPC